VPAAIAHVTVRQECCRSDLNSYSGGDAEMNAAIEEAQRRLPEFRWPGLRGWACNLCYTYFPTLPARDPSAQAIGLGIEQYIHHGACRAAIRLAFDGRQVCY